MREAFDGTEPANQLTANRSVFLTRRDNTLYLLLLDPPTTNGVRLKPLGLMPRLAHLLNVGDPVTCILDRPAFDAHLGRDFLRLHDLPLHRMADEVPVVRMEFDELPDSLDNLNLTEQRV